MYRIDKTKKMVALEPHLEADYLEKILNDEYHLIDNGSSRAVFDTETGLVIKLALEPEGVVQNETEIELYRFFGGENLAHIYAYGKNIIIMEWVDIDYKDIYELRDEYIEGYELMDRSGLTEEEAENYLDVIYFLNENLGETSDNAQIGYRYEDEVFVAYDYGFAVDNMEYSVGQISDILHDDEEFLKVMSELIERLLEKEEVI